MLLRHISAHRAAVGACDVVDGKTFVSSSNDGYVRIWDIDDGRLLRSISNPTEVWACAASQDRRLIAAAGPDAIIRSWDPSDGALLRRMSGHEDTVTSLVFRPCGAVVVHER